MNRVWIKLYLEILDDPKMGRLPDRLWRRSVEFFLLAGKNGNDGSLPPVEEIAWALRSSADEVRDCLNELSNFGFVHEEESGWFVSHFEKRQYSESYERVKRYRERYSNEKSNGESNEEEAPLSSSSSSSDSSSDSLEGGGAGEGTIPETPKQAAEHPDIQTYNRVSGRFPGRRDYQTVIETIQLLRKEHGSNLDEYLAPYWTAWSSRKSKGGKPYSPASLVWLCEWAMQGEVPRANGHEPQQGDSNNRADVIRKVVQNAR